jgi:hypothetical protein
MGIPVQAELERMPDALKIEQAVEGAEKESRNQLVPGLTPDLEVALIGIVEKFEKENYETWRRFMADMTEAELFWRDLHYNYYNHEVAEYTPFSVNDLKQLGESGQRFSYVTNYYRAWGWSLTSVLGQKIPTVRFLPSDFRKPQDVITARRATDTATFIFRNNQVKQKNIRAAYLLYTHGVVGSYTRYLVNGERFGYKKVPMYEMQPTVLQPGGYACRECMAFSEGPEMPEGADCPECGAFMNEADYQMPIEGEAPMQVGEKEVPRGNVLITLHGGLELRLPPWTAEKSDWPMLGLVNEVHESMLKATFGERAKNVRPPGASGDSFGTWDRTARLAVTEASTTFYSSANPSLITTKQYWLRPAAFEMAEGDMPLVQGGSGGTVKDALKQLFPKGVKIVYANKDQLLDARAESMDDHWEIANGLEGAGAYKPALGASAISINKRINTHDSFTMEWLEYAAAGGGGFVNVGLLNIGAITRHRRAPGTWYPVKFPTSVPISNAIQEGRPGQIAGEVFVQRDKLESVGRDLSGAVHTLSGGTTLSLKPTTYLADREQAMGRMFVPWCNLQTLWANTSAKGVREHAKNAPEDEVFTLWGTGGDYVGKVIPIGDLAGEFEAYPEINEEFPSLWHQTQAMWMKLMESPDEYVKEIMGHGRNSALLKAMVGTDFYLPGENDRLKQEIEIRLLLEAEPMVEEVLDPMGMPTMNITPTIMPEWADDDEEHIMHIKEWCVSPEGMAAKESNPSGYANCIAHGQAHEQALINKAIQQRQLEMAVSAPVPSPPNDAPKDEREAAIDGAKREIEEEIA